VSPDTKVGLRGVGWLVLAVPALIQLYLLATAIVGRIAYPYDLEWMEGGMLHHALRLQTGAGIYGEPSIEFIPYLYTPLYPALLATFGEVFGLTYTLGRTISVMSLVGIAVVAYMSICAPRFRHVAIMPGLVGTTLALGLFAAVYPYVEGWYDLVRADTLFLLLITAGLAGAANWSQTGEGANGHARVAAVAAILAFSFFAKQTGILYVALGGLIVLIVAWRRLPTYIAVAGVIGLGGSGLANWSTKGWFWVYIREIHSKHDFNMDRFWKSFGNILWHFRGLTLLVAVTLVVVLFTWLRRPPEGARRELPRQTRPFLLWTSAFAVSTLVGAIGWGTEFAHFNAYMPAFLHGALAAGAAIPALAACAGIVWGARNHVQAVLHGTAAIAALVLALTCLHWRWKPQQFIPTAADVAAGDKLISRIKDIEGPVWMPSHPWYLALAGKQPYVHRMGVKDVTWRSARTCSPRSCSTTATCSSSCRSCARTTAPDSSCLPPRSHGCSPARRSGRRRSGCRRSWSSRLTTRASCSTSSSPRGRAGPARGRRGARGPSASHAPAKTSWWEPPASASPRACTEEMPRSVA
jgi:hypothetical protein